MHELSVAQGILNRARETAAENGASEIETMTLELGAATHVNPDQLQFCLETVATDTPLADADIVIETVEAQASCDCGWEGEPPTFEGTATTVPTARCPECGSGAEFTQGKECRLARIEVPES